MRVRIKKDPSSDNRWIIEVKHWWTGWMFVESCYGDDSEARALKVATAMLNPYIIEVKS